MRIVIIAGPNGAGKTTFAREYLPMEIGITSFVNADLIAAGISPFAPELVARRAGRLMLEEIDRNAAAGESFAFETTLAGRSYVHRLDAWRASGYRVKLIFLRLAAVTDAIERRRSGHRIIRRCPRRGG